MPIKKTTAKKTSKKKVTRKRAAVKRGPNAFLVLESYCGEYSQVSYTSEHRTSIDAVEYAQKEVLIRGDEYTFFVVQVLGKIESVRVAQEYKPL